MSANLITVELSSLSAVAAELDKQGGANAPHLAQEPRRNFSADMKGSRMMDALRGSGDPETAARVAALYDVMRAELPPTVQPAIQPGMCGAWVDVPSFLGGDIECFRSRMDQESTLAPVRIVCDVSHIWNVMPSAIDRCGAAVAAAALAASSGRPVEVVAVLSFRSSNTGKRVLVSASLDMQSGDIGSLSLMLANPDFLRRAMFGIGAHAAGASAESVLQEAIGYDADTKARARAYAEGAIYVERLTQSDNHRSVQEWTDWAKEQLRKIEGEPLDY